MTDDSFDDDRTVFRPAAAGTPGPLDGQAEHRATRGDPAPPDDEALASGAALPIGSFIGEFELTAVVGEGGFGIVYAAWDHSLQRRVALKEYLPPTLARRAGSTQVQALSESHRDTFLLGLDSFINEARLLARFDHRSLVKVYRFWEANGTAYMVMPYYEGETLAARTARLGAHPDEAWLMSLLDPLSSALEILHREHCYHRDVAPDNIILLAGSEQPVLLDFGAARQVLGDMTQALTVILKPGYAPVEQYAEAPNMKQGPWTDVYALAATMVFAITGRRPQAAVARLLHDEEVPLVQACAGRYSPRLLRAIDAALRVRPQDRTPSILALRDNLGLRAPGEDGGSGATATSRRQGLGARSIALLVAGTLAVFAAAGIAAYWFAASGDAGHPAVTRPVAAHGAAVRIVPSALLPSSTSAPAGAPSVVDATSAPAASQPVDVLAQLDLVARRHTDGFDVEARAVRSRLKIDQDDLQFSVRSSRDGYLTLLAYGPDGSLTALLPNPTLASPKVHAGQRVVVPSSMAARIPVGEPPGVERLLVLVSASPRDFEALGAGPAASGYVEFPSPAELARRIAQWPDPTPALLGRALTCRPADACDDYGAARFDLQVVR